MEAQLDQLDLILGHQVAGLTVLRNGLPRKIEVVQSHRLMELELLNAKEEEQVARLQQAESQRQIVMSMLASDMGLEASELTLAELVKRAPAPYRKRLDDRRSQLNAVISQIHSSQLLLKELLRISLDYVHFSLDIFAQIATAVPPAGYGGLGEISSAKPASWLVNQRA